MEKLYINVKILLTLIVVRPTSSFDDARNLSRYPNLDIVKNWLRNSMRQNDIYFI